MADPFPTALQRISDERWVTLDVVTRQKGRLIAAIEEFPDLAAVVRWAGDEEYGHHLRRLLAATPPAAGPGVHLAWPVDLLHDLDARIVGYVAPRVTGRKTFPLADYLDPAKRAGIAPLATRRHHLRVARNVATAVAALHHAGHGRIRGRHFRVDDRAGVVLVRADELAVDVPPAIITDDERRLSHVIGTLIGGQPYATGGSLGQHLRAMGEKGHEPPTAAEWFHAIREAEQALPREKVATAPPAETTLATASDLASALRRAKAATTGPSSTESKTTPSTPAHLSSGPPSGPMKPIVIRVPSTVVEPPGGRPSMERPIRPPSTPRPGPATSTASAVVAVRKVAATKEPEPPPAQPVTDPSPAPARAADQPVPARQSERPARPVAPWRRKPARSGETTAATAARLAFTVAFGLALGGIASVAPFAAFLAAVTVMFTRKAVDTGQRKSTMGHHQTAAIALSRLIPFATGGLALAAFILFDLLLVLGLVMAVAERLFEYGPGFTITWVLDLPEVPVLVRWFAFVVAGASGLSTGGGVYETLQERSGGRRMIATPAIALALIVGIAVLDAGVMWWPLPTTL